jgi:uncharacterized protein DUF4232
VVVPVVLRFATAALVIAFAASAHSSVAATTPRCATAGLVVWLGTAADHAAGSSYYKLGFTNLSGHTCTLHGFAGVSATSLAGHQLGRAAARSHTGTPRQIRLSSNATAVAVLQLVDVHNFSPSACHPVVAAALRVYPPNQTVSKLVPFPFSACSRAGPVYLLVRAVRKA